MSETQGFWRAAPPHEVHEAGVKARINLETGQSEVWQEGSASARHIPDPLQAALDLVAAGFRIFPCNNAPGTKRDKAPAGWLVPNGYQDATTDERRIRAWFDGTDYLIGVPTGEVNGFDCLDIDPRNGGDEWLHQNGGDLPRTRVHETGSGGLHLLFDAEPGLRSGTEKIAPGVDVKANGGYIIWWPAAGCQIARELPRAAWPAPVLQAIKEKQPAAVAQGGSVALERRCPPSADVVVALLDRMSNPDHAGRDVYENVMLAANGCIRALEEKGELVPEDAERIAEAAVGWAERWPGCKTDEWQKWLDDWSRREGKLAGYQTLQRVACELIPGYADELEQARGEQAKAEFAAASLEAPAKAKPAYRITPTPYVWRAPETIRPREWVYSEHYIRRYVTATFAPGAVGKSAHALVEALDMVTGRNILGKVQDPKPLRVWYWNGEDPHDELDRRIAAACLHHNISAADIDGRLFVNSGRDCPVVIATENRDGCTIQVPVVDALIAAIETCGIDVLILDPFVSVHRVNENDNGRIDVLVKQLGAIADHTGTAIELIHHTRKGQIGADRSVDDGRGAGALVAAARSVRVLNRMQPDEATLAGIGERARLSYFRVGTGEKSNLVAPAERAVWRRMANVPMNNGTDVRGMDFVGVVEPWTLPTPAETVAENLTAERIADLHRHLAEGAPNKRHVQAGAGWIGHTLAAVLGWDVDDSKKRLGRMVAELIRADILATEHIDNGHGRTVEIVVAGATTSL